MAIESVRRMTMGRQMEVRSGSVSDKGLKLPSLEIKSHKETLPNPDTIEVGVRKYSIRDEMKHVAAIKDEEDAHLEKMLQLDNSGWPNNLNDPLSSRKDKTELASLKSPFASPTTKPGLQLIQPELPPLAPLNTNVDSDPLQRSASDLISIPSAAPSPKMQSRYVKRNQRSVLRKSRRPSPIFVPPTYQKRQQCYAGPILPHSAFHPPQMNPAPLVEQDSNLKQMELAYAERQVHIARQNYVEALRKWENVQRQNGNGPLGMVGALNRQHEWDFGRNCEGPSDITLDTIQELEGMDTLQELDSLNPDTSSINFNPVVNMAEFCEDNDTLGEEQFMVC